MFKPSCSMPKRLFLARHGESVANQQKWLSGQLDTPLSEKGRDQAQWLCDVLKNEKLSAIYTSSLIRAVETARPSAEYHGIAIQQRDNFKELHFGILQGKSADEIAASQALWHSGLESKERPTAPGSEAYPDFENRITRQLAVVLQEVQDTALIVAHRNTNAVILSNLLGLNLEKGRVINVKNKYVYEICLGAGITVKTIRLGGEFHGTKFTGLKDD